MTGPTPQGPRATPDDDREPASRTTPGRPRDSASRQQRTGKESHQESAPAAGSPSVPAKPPGAK